VTAFHVIGGLTALWAVVVAGLGITREDFPRGAAEKVVGAISVLLVAGAISAAILTSETEGGHEGGGGHEAPPAEAH
jgi:hypothetical protein